MNLLTYDDLTEVLENVRLDGRRRNAISDCPYCGKSQKFGVSLVKDHNLWQCFSCGERGGSFKLMTYFDRLDLIQEFFDVDDELENPFDELEEEDLDLELEEVELPEDTKKVASDEYLEGRGWYDESFFDFPVYRSKYFKYRDYVMLGVMMYGSLVGYVSRHTWSKEDIENYNKIQKRKGGYQILRYKNSDGNEFSKMLYGFDTIIEGKTDTVILVEGAMDVVQITQELELFEGESLRAVASFGKKISEEQIFHLQEKGVKNLIVMFDDDAIEDVKRLDLDKYFNVLIASTNDADGVEEGDDVGDLDAEQIEQCLGMARKPSEFFYEKVNIIKL